MSTEKNKWNDIKDKEPKKDSYVVLFRSGYPMSFWLGKYEDYHCYDETDLFTHWIEVEKPPEKQGE